MTAAPLGIGTTVRIRPCHNGKRLPARNGVILEPWSAEGDWLVWFYTKDGGAFQAGATIQGFLNHELTPAVTGDLNDIPERRLAAMERTLSRAQTSQASALGWKIHAARTARKRRNNDEAR